MTIAAESDHPHQARHVGTRHGSLAEQVLAHAQAGREVIQDFVPLAASIEWSLGQEYLRQRGNKAFLSDVSPVPFAINNDGTLSHRATEVFFESLRAAERDGTLEDEIVVLELGIGVGLFARYFLDAMRELSRRHKKDYYDRLTYIAADRSERMLHDVLRHGVLGGHPGRYRVLQMDAMQPEAALVGQVCNLPAANGQVANLPHAPVVGQDSDLVMGGQPTRSESCPTTRLRAVFLNYLLDCLPAAVLHFDGDAVRQLCVRTCVARNVRLADYTDLTAQQLRQRAQALNPKPEAGNPKSEFRNPKQIQNTKSEIVNEEATKRARQELLEVYGLFASEYDYQPVRDGAPLAPRADGEGKGQAQSARGASGALWPVPPYFDFAVEYARGWTKRLLHSYGAIACLDKLLGMLAPGGFILVNDYGPTHTSRDDEFEHQRFSLATFVGVNFAELRAYSGEAPPLTPGPSPPEGRGEKRKRCQYVEPAGEEGRGIHARLLGHAVAEDVRVCFAERFGEAAHKRLQEPIDKARAWARAGRFEMAADCYNDAIHLQPGNWVLLCEVSHFLTFQLGDAKAAADMAKMALALNPTCSAELWNALGDALFKWGRVEEARSAYEKALAVNAADVRARYNLAWVHARLKDYPAALGRIAEALALDKTGEYRDALLQKQREVLGLLTERHQQEYLLLINLVSRRGKQDGQKAGEEPPVAGTGR